VSDLLKVIKENKKRNETLDAVYDPLNGINSPIDRFEFTVTDGFTILLPKEMLEIEIINDILQYPSLEKFVKIKYPGNEDKIIELFEFIQETRDKYDFEYWSYTKAKIKPKEGGVEIRFKLNRPQRRVLAKLEKMRTSGVPIRLIILKARQWGGSTLVQIYMAWIQIIHKINWNSLIAADVNQQAINIRKMYKTLTEHYPDEEIELKNFESTVNIKEIKSRKNKITIGSMQKPETIRSDDVAMAHLSEVGLWKKTDGKEPKDLAQAILGTIDYKPYTIYVLESTAKGVGNYFHKEYTDAVEGRNNLQPIFIAWHEIERYRSAPLEDKEAKEIYKSLDDYETWLWNLGATLEGIKWYRAKLKEYSGDTWRMRSEFPSDAMEAFQSTGRRVYAPSLVEKTRANCKPPQYIGQLFADGAKGEEALTNVNFEENNKGEFWVWELPDKSVKCQHRYIVSVDIGGASKGADWSVIRVQDRYWMLFGGVPEFIATWKLHIDQDLLAWRACQVGTFYNDALVVFENNSLKKNKNTEGEGFLTILNEIADYYPNLYIKASPQDAVKEGMPVKYGFHTNSATKDMIINTKIAAMRDDEYIERDSRACDESDTFERKEDGSVGAVDGCHDDIEMCTDIGLWVSLKDMPMPFIVDEEGMKQRRRKKKTKTKGAASF